MINASKEIVRYWIFFCLLVAQKKKNFNDELSELLPNKHKPGKPGKTGKVYSTEFITRRTALILCRTFALLRNQMKLLTPLKAKTAIYVASLGLFMLVSTLFYHHYEGWSPEEAISFAVVTLSTVGKILNEHNAVYVLSKCIYLACFCL
jgi:hypothetical protein